MILNKKLILEGLRQEIEEDQKIFISEDGNLWMFLNKEKSFIVPVKYTGKGDKRIFFYEREERKKFDEEKNKKWKGKEFTIEEFLSNEGKDFFLNRNESINDQAKVNFDGAKNAEEDKPADDEKRRKKLQDKVEKGRGTEGKDKPDDEPEEDEENDENKQIDFMKALKDRKAKEEKEKADDEPEEDDEDEEEEEEKKPSKSKKKVESKRKYKHSTNNLSYKTHRISKDASRTGEENRNYSYRIASNDFDRLKNTVRDLKGIVLGKPKSEDVINLLIHNGKTLDFDSLKNRFPPSLLDKREKELKKAKEEKRDLEQKDSRFGRGARKKTREEDEILANEEVISEAFKDLFKNTYEKEDDVVYSIKNLSAKLSPSEAVEIYSDKYNSIREEYLERVNKLISIYEKRAKKILTKAEKLFKRYDSVSKYTKHSSDETYFQDFTEVLNELRRVIVRFSDSCTSVLVEYKEYLEQLITLASRESAAEKWLDSRAGELARRRVSIRNTEDLKREAKSKARKEAATEKLKVAKGKLGERAKDFKEKLKVAKGKTEEFATKRAEDAKQKGPELKEVLSATVNAANQKIIELNNALERMLRNRKLNNRTVKEDIDNQKSLTEVKKDISELSKQNGQTVLELIKKISKFDGSDKSFIEIKNYFDLNSPKFKELTFQQAKIIVDNIKIHTQKNEVSKQQAEDFTEIINKVVNSAKTFATRLNLESKEEEIPKDARPALEVNDEDEKEDEKEDKEEPSNLFKKAKEKLEKK